MTLQGNSLQLLKMAMKGLKYLNGVLRLTHLALVHVPRTLVVV